MNLYAFMACSLVNGPGRRSVTWFQGCELDCPGCWNAQTHSRDAGTPTTSPSELVARICHARLQYRIEGVTFSGGEPIHQIGAITQMLLMLKLSAPNLSAGLFSGYTEKELDLGKFETYEVSDAPGRREMWRDLRKLLDFAVLGRFNQHQPCSEPLISSRNQQLRLFSPRYAARDFEEQTVEVSIGPNGLTQITGFPTLGVLD